MSGLLRRWRYRPRRSAVTAHPDPMPAVDPWLWTAHTVLLPTIGA